MQFALGYIAGVATCAFIAAMLAFFRRQIVSAVTAAEVTIARNGPGGSGFVYDPPSEAEVARQAHIEKNAAAGRDTPIAELL